MKIAIVSSTFFPRMGGAEMTMHNLGIALANGGHDVHMVVPGSHKLRDFHPPYTLTPLIIPRGSVRLGLLEYVMMANLLHLQKKHQFDVWQIFITYPAGYAAILAKKFVNVPVIVSAQGKDIQKMPEIGYGLRLDKKIERKIQQVVQQADALLTISNSTTEAYRDIGAPEHLIKYIPNGIWYEQFQRVRKNQEKIRRRLRSELQIPSDEPILLCTARNHPKKNYPTLFQAMGLMRDRGLKAHLVVAGAGTEQLRDRVRELGLQDRVHLLGVYPRHFGKFDELPPKELIELYVASDMFVFPSLIESFGIVLIEAMAAGLPIVAANVEGVQNVVSADHDGVLISRPEDADELARAIQGVLSDQEYRDHLVHNGLETAKQYDWDVLVKDFELLYKDVMD